jgi:hypothetical protein
MSIHWMNYILKERRDLKGSNLLCALIIANYASVDDRCFPGLRRIASDLRCTVRQVQRTLRGLEKLKVFRIERGTGRGNKISFALIKDDINVIVSTPERATPASPLAEAKRRHVAPEKGDISGKKRRQIAQKNYAHIRNEVLEPDMKNNKTADKPPTDHHVLMNHHSNRIGKIFNGAALGRAIKELLETYSAADCIECYNALLPELKLRGGWRDRVDWLTVQSIIGEFQDARTDGTHKNSPRQLQTTDELRRELGVY